MGVSSSRGVSLTTGDFPGEIGESSKFRLRHVQRNHMIYQISIHIPDVFPYTWKRSSSYTWIYIYMYNIYIYVYIYMYIYINHRIFYHSYLDHSPNLLMDPIRNGYPPIPATRRQGPYTDQLQVALAQHLQLQEAYCRGGWLKLHMAFQKLTGAELTKAPGILKSLGADLVLEVFFHLGMGQYL